jgi:hypothetical protein
MSTRCSSTLMLALTLCSCSYEPASVEDVRPDVAMFESSVYPVLLRDCAFYACHGNGERFFRVYGPGRLRISDELETYDPATAAEIHHTYERARSMLQGVHGIDDSLLLRKPLDSREGGSGSGHRGTDRWGHDVYRLRDDIAYQAIVAWAKAARSEQSKDGEPEEAP